jgi:hypothetical protein
MMITVKKSGGRYSMQHHRVRQASLSEPKPAPGGQCGVGWPQPRGLMGGDL